MNQELINVFQPGKEIPTFDRIRISLASPDQILRWSPRRDQKAGDHQLPHLQAGA